MASVYWDTVGVSEGPVKVLKAYFVEKVTAIRFRYYGLMFSVILQTWEHQRKKVLAVVLWMMN